MKFSWHDREVGDADNHMAIRREWRIEEDTAHRRRTCASVIGI